MSLAVGSHLGPYDILSALGAGGMGEVYRAHDTTLDRDVALKILPETFIHDADRLARFKREAQVLASLNHPNIAAIYGFESSNGLQALVLELVEGPTLADRIAQGPMPIDEAMPIAKQIAEALEAAHEQGIIHRDLKPANIKVRADGTVKVLDFGLAKAFDPSTSPGAGATMSPTLSLHATQAGLILGTAAYMAPEQARGKAVDKRADNWAFGCVLFEMLTGRRAFDGDDISTTLASVLKTDPDWKALPPATPASLHRLLRWCLDKDPKRRLQAIGDARVQLEDLLGGALEPVTSPVSPGHPLWRSAMAVAVLVLLAAVSTGVIVWLVARSSTARTRVVRFEITPPTTAALSITGSSRDVALAPDGSRIVYIGAGGTTLFVRALDQLEATPLVRGGAFRDPFVSPDGQWVGFFDQLTLKKVAITGGPAITLARLDAPSRGATWAADGSIIFATFSTTTGLLRVSADGGTPAVLTRPDHTRGETTHTWPEVLPGGHAVLYTVASTEPASAIFILDLRNNRSSIVLRGGNHAQYVPSGHLLYAAAGSLRAIAFDLTRGIVVGTSTAVVSQANLTRTGGANASLASDGTLVYVSEAAGGRLRTLVWVDGQGHETPLAAQPRAYVQPRISPDGSRVAVVVQDRNNTDIWLWDLVRATLTRVTSDPTVNATPVWAPDGQSLVFNSNRTGQFNLFTQAADGTGAVERLTESPNTQAASAVSPDGTRLVFTQGSPTTGSDVMALRLDGTHQVVPLVQTPFTERNGIVSPDGRWLAYEANDTGSFEVYVRPFPNVTRGHWQVSTSGGMQPLWARNGQDLFYFAPDGALMRVAVATGSTWNPGPPTKLLEGRYLVDAGGLFIRNYDVTADGQRFLMLKAGGDDAKSAAPQIVVVQHFDEELKRLVPVK